MLLPVLAALAVAQVAYHIPSQPSHYSLDVKLDGFIPLFGLKQAKAEVQVDLVVKGMEPQGDDNPRASTDVSDLKILLDGSPLPFGKETVAKFFPNTVTLTPLGKVIKIDAPDIQMPVQLPGLDVKRFPYITFLAVEFPAGGIEVGKAFTYTREFGKSTVTYTVTPTDVSDGEVKMDVKMTQDYENEEGDSNDVVKDPKDAVYDVKTHVEGAGTVDFDRHAGLIKSVRLDADAVGTVVKIDTKEETKRDLKTHMDVKLDK